MAVLRALALALFVVGWATCKWVTGADWRHGYTGRRRITRPVRATAQSLVAVVGGCAVWRPLATVATLGAGGLVLVVTALISRNQTPRLVSQPGGPYRTTAYVIRPRQEVTR
jgi:hypothetical protein